MAFEIPGKMISLIAAADFSAAQYTGVALSATGKGAVPAAHAHILGVCQNDPENGAAMNVMTTGVTKMVAGEAVDPGPVSVDNLGRAVEANTAGWVVIGRALEGCTAAGVLIPVLLENEGPVPA